MRFKLNPLASNGLSVIEENTTVIASGGGSSSSGGGVTSVNTRTGDVVINSTDVADAGALMDSELTSIASVKALNQGVSTTDSPTFAGGTLNGTLNLNSNNAFKLYGDVGVTQRALFGAGRNDDMTLSTTALYQWLRIGNNQGTIGIWTDGNVGTSDAPQFVLNGSAIRPYTDSTGTLGGTSHYWSNTYTDRLYLNSTAYLDGGTAGVMAATGAISSTSFRASGGYSKTTPQFNGGIFGAHNLTGTGMSMSVNGTYFSHNGSSVLAFNSSGFILTSSLTLGFSSAAADSANANVAFSSLGAASMALGNGTAGNTTGKLTLGEIEITDTAKGVILTAPDASRWRITVDNSGVLTTTSI